MNRTELVAALAERTEVTRKDADAVLTALAETVGEIVAKGDEKVTIPGFLSACFRSRVLRSLGI
ncbi:HU family DNA-binding protein [Actinacidiphila sp. ITFR-21]|uniref:HU family DNA-binding protein n=1 Tax=Actinacidiphila sp. ITFR-21 TaxID=3075199 RepID=UPI00288BDC31|nr:HU family DNA-binding protein [Streptomyces sp. ITFR-21]WNI20019.1 HU family DNA-binding protein [Streptomyces sp. ITFR-21]